MEKPEPRYQDIFDDYLHRQQDHQDKIIKELEK